MICGMLGVTVLSFLPTAFNVDLCDGLYEGSHLKWHYTTPHKKPVTYPATLKHGENVDISKVGGARLR
mgnify:CR=1 FL=1